MRIQRRIDPVIAICLSDLHLSLRPPRARAKETDWQRAMNRMILQLKTLAGNHDALILCAGDIFHRWNASAELINWALEKLPHMYGIPGNHDLPTHRQDLSYKSAYGTLVRAGRITELGPEPLGRGRMMLYGQPFNGKTPKVRTHHAEAIGLLHVLLTHEYLWSGQHHYQRAPEEQRLGKTSRRFRKFDVVVVGDNHKGFLRSLKSGTKVINCGSFIRRNSDEEGYSPQVGLIHQSGNVTLHFLNTRRDLITPTIKKAKAEDDEEVVDFLKKLSEVETVNLSFRETMLRALKEADVSDEVRDLIKEAMG